MQARRASADSAGAPPPLLRQHIGQRNKLLRLFPRRQRRAGGKIIDRPGFRLPGLKAVEHHAVGKELEIIQRQDITPAALAAADITVDLQQIIHLFHRGDVDLVFAAHKPIRRQRLSGRDLAGEDLCAQLGIDLLIQTFTAVPVSFKLLHPLTHCSGTLFGLYHFTSRRQTVAAGHRACYKGITPYIVTFEKLFQEIRKERKHHHGSENLRSRDGRRPRQPCAQ